MTLFETKAKHGMCIHCGYAVVWLDRRDVALSLSNPAITTRKVRNRAAKEARLYEDRIVKGKVKQIRELEHLRNKSKDLPNAIHIKKGKKK